MKNLNWIVVLRLEEFISYYDTKALIELSMICKNFRNFLNSKIFKTFNFSNFVSQYPYKSYVISDHERETKWKKDDTDVDDKGDNVDQDECEYEENNSDNSNISESDISYLINPYEALTEKLIDSSNQFNLKLNLFKSRPSRLYVNMCQEHYYLLYDIPNLFKKLTTLIINSSHIKIEIFQNLLDNLIHLESLELKYNYILQYCYANIQIPINWPSSLKKINFSNNYAACVKDKSTLIKLYEGDLYNTSNHYLKLTPKHIFQLTTFECRMFGEDFENEGLYKFLKLNPQIKNLKIGGSNLTSKLFDNIKSYVRLTHLELNYYNYILSESEMSNITVPNTISHLFIILNNRTDNIDRVIDKFPNFISLFLEIRYGSFVQLLNLAIKVSKFKNLNLKMYYKQPCPIEITLPSLDNLISLEFMFHSFSAFDNINLNLDSSKNLKLVKFEEEKIQRTLGQSKFNPKLSGFWKIIHFHHKINCYRIEK